MQAPMRYKTFVWPHNPRVYSIEFHRSIAVNKIPYGRYALQNFYIKCHPQEAQRQIYEAVKKAVERENEMEAYSLQCPIEAKIRFKRMDEANAAKLYDINRQPFGYEDAFTRVGTIASVRQLFD